MGTFAHVDQCPAQARSQGGQKMFSAQACSPRQRNNRASASGYGAVRPAPSEPSRLLQQPDLLEIADQSRCRELVSAVSILPFRSRAKCDWAASCSALLNLTSRQRACALSGHPASRTMRPSSGDWSKAGRTDRITPPVPPSKSSISSEPFGEIGPKFPRNAQRIRPAPPSPASTQQSRWQNS